MFGFQLSLFYCFAFWIPNVNFLILLHFAFWIPIVNFLILLHFAFWIPIVNFLILLRFVFWIRIANFLCFEFWIPVYQYPNFSIERLRGRYECFIGNMKAGTSCLGAKYCPLIRHLDMADSCYGRGEACASPKLHCGRMRKWRTHARESEHTYGTR